MDPEILLQSKSDTAPSGENLEYDPVFTEMELAAQPGEESVMGDERIEASDPDYREVRVKALEVLEQSHEIRAAVFLADAVLNMDGPEEFAKATTLVRGCLEQFWDTCHPELDEDDGDATMRINAVQGLCGQPDGMGGPSPIYRSLRRVPLTNSRGFGRFSLRDIEVAEGLVAAPEDMENPPDAATVSAAFQDSDSDELERWLAAWDQAEADVRAISAVFDDKTPGEGPELDPLIKLLRTLSGKMRSLGGMAAGDEGQAETDDETAVAASGAVAAAPAVAAVPGAINTPADVTNALDRIISYYQRVEPSSPLPILLERAKRLVGADFLTIVKDMAPEGMDNVQIVGGLDDDD